MLTIPLKQVPSQTLQVTVGGQNARITVRTIGRLVYFSLEGVAVVRLVRDRVRLLLDAQYQGFAGDFVFIDTQGKADPVYTGLGTRWQLVYLDAVA